MTDKLSATRDTADKQLEFLAQKAVGRRLTAGVRAELARLAELLGAEGRTCDPVGFATVQRLYAGHLPKWDLDFDLIDAALAAGVPFAAPPPGTVVSLRSWADRARRGGLGTVAADPRFRPLLREALFDRRGDLLALGRPGCVLRDHAGFAEAVLGAPGLVDILRECVETWADAVRAGSLPVLHEAVYFLDLLGPARLADACPEVRALIGELLTVDLAEVVAATWRGGLVDELGDAALDRFGSFWHSDDVFRLAPGEGADEDSFVVAGNGRATVFGPRGVVAGPLYLRFPAEAGSSPTSDRFLYERGQFAASAPLADDAPTPVAFPGAAHQGELERELRRGPGDWWELLDAKGVVVGRWYQGPSRPARVAGTHSVGRRRHRWASGSELVTPPQVWGRLPARDEAASRLLRGADAATAAGVLDAIDSTLADQITAVGRRVPVGDHSHEVDDCFDAIRAALEPVFPESAFPEPDADRLLDGIAGTIWSAVECRVLSGRHVEGGAPSARHVDDGEPTARDIESGASGRAGAEPAAAPVLRAVPLPYPITDPGDLRARIFTDMQEMFYRLSRTAEKCADPEVATPPLTVRLANARRWENALGRLGCRALRAALSPAGPDQRSTDLGADHVRAWGGPPLCDPGGRWRTLSLRVDGGTVPKEGQVSRTARGCLIVLQGSLGNSSDIAAIEYAADGVFGEPPFGAVESARVCAGWGGAERVAAFLRLLDTRGPAPWPEASIRAFGGATGLSVEEASLLAVGFDPYDAYMIGRGAHGMPTPLLERSGLDEVRVQEAGRYLARAATVDQRLEIPELLMPDDPAHLWEDRLDAERAAAWWTANVVD